ncbi:MAG: CoA protein activase, partial [Clostridia bacterium]
MIITYPHMGSLSWLLGALFREQGIPFISPPPCSKQTLEVGVRYAPQGACLPMKIVLGNFLEAQKQGADTALFFGGCGPCRFGYFAAMFQGICEEWGIPLRIIALEAPDHDIRELFRRIQDVMGKKARQLPILVAEGIRAAKALDEAEEIVGDAKLFLSGQSEKLQLEHWEQDWRRKAEQ